MLVGFLGVMLSVRSDSGDHSYQSSCLAQPFIVLAEYQQYQVIQATSTDGHGHHPEEILVTVQNDICSRLNPHSDNDYPFSRYIDPEAAIALNEQLWRRKIDAQGGKEEFEAGFAAFARESDEILYMPADRYQALKNLAIEIPNNVQPADEPPAFSDSPTRP
ncbi:hypothetical protein AWQ21_14850 (plasmid) [Picosynechococcus sp. PCC 7003]|uniref:hypothetical protein n=1 Tax=Picosynechococcus sp. PCC 7003 TaxID=374981 RepID=UPI0008109E2E|nr:hypothetical protein [Picosynechococcus sp. PCC 7003]ANV85808.1 hypothetical protein AWQ21_14850 [Picosynechococcus sp. PCC 7003]